MPETEENNFTQEVPLHIAETINKEVDKDTAPIEEEDPATADFLREIMPDLKTQSYKLLSWIKDEFNPKRVLYPASGFNMIPKLAFGEDKVIHTSLEDTVIDPAYFDRLGSGERVKADNNSLPFKPESFQVVCILDSQFEIVGKDKDQYINILSENGILVLSTNVLDTEPERIDDYASSDRLETIEVPEVFQLQGESQSEFYIFRKK